VSKKAEKYERRFPGTGASEAQKEERQERAEFKEERRTLRRTGRNRGIIVPDLPWLRGKEQST
jgi:hypothetical protein